MRDEEFITMKVLVVGSGGREHALAWKLKQSADVDEVIVAPGNAGTHQEPGVRNVDIAATDTVGLITLCQRENIAFTVVGPEVPLVAGLGAAPRRLQIFQQRLYATLCNSHSSPSNVHRCCYGEGLCSITGCTHRDKGRRPGGW